MEATTADGRKVVLDPDGSWKFKENSEATKQGTGYTKSTGAKAVLKSKRGFLEIWYKSEKWSPKDGDDTTEFRLTHKDGDVYALAVVEWIAVPLSTLRKIALDNTKRAAPDAKIVFEEEREVNGVKLLAMQIEATVQEIQFTYFDYFWSGKAGTIQVLTYTSRNLFPQVKQDMEELLNGVVITGE